MEGPKQRDLVFMLGDTEDGKGDGGQFRLNLGPVDHSGGGGGGHGIRSRMQKEEQDAARAATEGICISRTLHKTFSKGDTFLWLSLPDVLLMDSYEKIAIDMLYQSRSNCGQSWQGSEAPQGWFWL